VDAEFVKQLFESKAVLLADLAAVRKSELSVRMTKQGEVLGSAAFLKMTLKRISNNETMTRTDPCFPVNTYIRLRLMMRVMYQ
jgi:hypothetical protein